MCCCLEGRNALSDRMLRRYWREMSEKIALSEAQFLNGHPAKRVDSTKDVERMQRYDNTLIRLSNTGEC